MAIFLVSLTKPARMPAAISNRAVRLSCRERLAPHDPSWLARLVRSISPLLRFEQTAISCTEDLDSTCSNGVLNSRVPPIWDDHDQIVTAAADGLGPEAQNVEAILQRL